MHGTFPVISCILWNMSENLHYKSDGYISKSYSTCKNTIDRQYTGGGGGAAVVSTITSCKLVQCNCGNVEIMKKSATTEYRAIF